MYTAPAPTRRKPRVFIAACCTALLLSATGVGAASAVTTEPATSPAESRQASFRGTAFAAGPEENIDIFGRLHAVVQLSGSESSGWTLDWHANLDDTTGIGQASGDRYLARGAGRGTVTHPPSPIRPATFELTFTLFPPGPPVHPPSPIRLSAHVVFEENGRLSGLEVRLGQAPIGSVD